MGLSESIFDLLFANTVPGSAQLAPAALAPSKRSRRFNLIGYSPFLWRTHTINFTFFATGLELFYGDCLGDQLFPN